MTSNKKQSSEAAVREIRRRGFHACRHTHASRLLADLVPVTDVAKRLGHASPAVTMSIYAHAMPGQDEATARVVDQWFMPRNLEGNLRG